MRTIRIIALLVVLVMASKVNWAQSSNLGMWYMYMANQKIGERWNWWNEIQYRDYQMFGDIEQLLIRTAAGYDLSPKNNTLSLGYGYIHSQSYNPAFPEDKDQKAKSDEHRIYQQYFTKQHFGRFYINHRFRIEQRLINASSQWKHRWRYFLQLRVAISKPEIEEGCVYFSAYNEIFLEPTAFDFDRMRTYTAAGMQIAPSFKLEAGVMYQNVDHNGRTQLQILLINTLPFKKKE